MLIEPIYYHLWVLQKAFLASTCLDTTLHCYFHIMHGPPKVSIEHLYIVQLTPW